MSRRTLLVTYRGRTTVVELGGRGTLVIGRSRSCDVYIDDHQVSRRHAAIHVEPGQLHVEDLGSHNGTLLVASIVGTDEIRTGQANERQLAANERTPLPDDAMIKIGPVVVTINAPDDRRPSVAHRGFVAVDPAMRRVVELADRVAPTNLTVLLLGESGAGKDVLARYLHDTSPRARGQLISLNCGALPETLLESELFGHEKGAFTGAFAAKPGLFEAASGGTVFLDEVGELTPALQVKLLRVLEDRQVMRVGALAPITVDVRFVAATNRDLEQHVADGSFREDLYYRLNGIALYVPPLRERPADVVPLAEWFLADLSAQLGRSAPALSLSAIERLRGYGWPGNVRQLKNVIHRALVMASGSAIGADDIDLPERDSRPSIPTLIDVHEIEQPAYGADDGERRRIVDALDRCAGNQTRAAQVLGMTRRALVRRLGKYNLPRPRRGAGDDEDSPR